VIVLLHFFSDSVTLLKIGQFIKLRQTKNCAKFLGPPCILVFLMIPSYLFMSSSFCFLVVLSAPKLSQQQTFQTDVPLESVSRVRRFLPTFYIIEPLLLSILMTVPLSILIQLIYLL